MGDISVKITEVDNVSHVPVDITSVPPVEISSIDRIGQIAPVAVHIKELNQVDPLLIESLRIDRVSNIDPLSVDQLNVTRLPVVNLSINQAPEIAIAVKSVPSVPIALTQAFDLDSDYSARARLLGFEVLRLRLTGSTRATPRDLARREQAHSPDTSFPRVAAGGNPAIPSRMEERSAVVTAGLRCGAPRFAYSARDRED
jgi:hypothetical protein